VCDECFDAGLLIFVHGRLWPD